MKVDVDQLHKALSSEQRKVQTCVEIGGNNTTVGAITHTYVHHALVAARITSIVLIVVRDFDNLLCIRYIITSHVQWSATERVYDK